MDRNPLMRFLLGLMLVIGSAPALAAQRELYSIRGTVKDSEGAPLEGVEILLETPQRTTRTDKDGRFVMDSVPGGQRRLLVRRIGYLGMRFLVTVPREPVEEVRIILIPQPQQLAAIEVQVERKGIYGVVGDTAYHALPGTLVEILGARVADTTDATGRFSFEDLKSRHLVLRVSRPGYYGRLVSVDYAGKGREFSVFLTPYQKGSFDWANSREAAFALPDLAARLATEPKRNRMTREELLRFGTLALCDVPKIRSITGREPNIIMRGSTWMRNADLCAWSADQFDLIEFGSDPCKEGWKTISNVLGVYCGPTVGRGTSTLYGAPPTRRSSYVVLWPRG